MSAAPDLAPKLHTAGDLERLSAEGHRYELIHGRLRQMPPAGGEHGSLTKRLDNPLTSFIYEHDLGECFTAETGFTVSRDPDTVLAPDWAFIHHDRVPHPLPRGFAEVVPDIVLETRSPGDTRSEVAEKVALWLTAGVRVVLELDPGRRRLAVHRPGTEPQVLGEADTLTLGDVLPGFSVPLARLFPRR